MSCVAQMRHVSLSTLQLHTAQHVEIAHGWWTHFQWLNIGDVATPLNVSAHHAQSVVYSGVQLGSCGDDTTAEDLQQHVIQDGMERAALARSVYRQLILRVARHMTKGADDWAQLITLVGGQGQKPADAGLKRRHSIAFKDAEVPEAHAQQERAAVTSSVHSAALLRLGLRLWRGTPLRPMSFPTWRGRRVNDMHSIGMQRGNP